MNPSAGEVDRYMQELDRQYFAERWEQAVFDVQPEPNLFADAVMILGVFVMICVICLGAARAI